MTSTPSPRRHRLRPPAAAVLGLAAVLAAAPATAGAILAPERPDSVMEPLAPAAAFDLEVTQNRRLGPLTTVRLLDLRSTSSRDLTSASVFWGDGTTSRIALSPDVTYAHLTFPQHRYPIVWERRQYDIAVQVADTGGAVRQQGWRLATAPAFRVHLNPIAFRATSDCDWVGEGDFEFKNYQTGDVDSFDLGAGDSTTVVRDGYTARVILGDDAVFRYYWIEDDPGLDAPWPGDGRTISMRPGTADKPHRTLTRYEQEPTDAGCGANLTYTVFTYIQAD